MTTGNSNDAGFALISVLIVAALIAMLASGLMLLVRSLASESDRFSLEVELRAANEAGLNRMILAYSRAGDSLRPFLFPDGRPASWSFSGHEIQLSVQAESGKLDLNAGDLSHIKLVADELFDDADTAQRFVSDLTRHRASGTIIRNTSSLLHAFARMTSLQEKADRHFTTATGQRGVDPTTASPLILKHLPGLTVETVKTILDARAELGRMQNYHLPEGIARYLAVERPIYTIRSLTTIRGRVAAMKALVSFSERGTVSVHEWSSVGITR